MWTEPIYVVRTDDDSDAICCEDKEEAQKAIDYIQAHSLDGGKEITWCKTISEDQLLADYSKPGAAYDSEEAAADDGYGWDDEFGRWLNINIDPFQVWYYRHYIE